MEGRSKGFCQGGIAGIDAFRNGNQHLRKYLDIFGKTARQIADPRGAPVHPAEVRFAGKAVRALPAVGGTDADFGAHGKAFGLGALFNNGAADFVSRNVAVGQMASGYQGMIGTAKAGVGDFHQHFIRTHCIIRNVFINQPPVFSKDNSFHKF